MFVTEDVVRNRATEILGLGDQDETPDRAEHSGTGQITTFNKLGFPGVNDKPDGWYLPKNRANPALILETKASDKDLHATQWEQELFKNLDVVLKKYEKAVGILHNGEETRVFLQRRDSEPTLNPKAPQKLQSKEYYFSLFSEDKIDQSKIYSLTKKINDSLHFNFGIRNLNHRMIFTACALVAKRFGANFLPGMDYQQFHSTIHNTLNKNGINDGNHADKIEVLRDVFTEIKMNLNVKSDNEKTSDRVKGWIQEFMGWVTQISDDLASSAWNGEDVMSIFFNEFSRYRGKSESGQVFTPDHVTSFMYKLIDVTYRDGVLDAACGSGAFLVKSMANMIDEIGGPNADGVEKLKRTQFFGIENDREIFALACANMLIHKDGRSNVEMMDARYEEAAEWIGKQKKISKVLMNQPYEESYGCSKILENVLFSVPTGTDCAFLLPDKKLEKAPQGRIKRILKNHSLTHVIKMPKDLFFGIGATTSIFVFKTGTPQNGEEFFSCNIEEDGLVTVKNQGRQDVHNRWPAIETEWLKIIKRRAGHYSAQWNDPNDCLSWQEPVQPFSINREDFLKTAMDYQAYQAESDVDQLREKIASAVLFGSDIKQSKNPDGTVELSITLTQKPGN